MTPSFDRRLERVAWFLDDYCEMLGRMCPHGEADDLIAEARELRNFVRGALPIANCEPVRLTKNGIEVRDMREVRA